MGEKELVAEIVKSGTWLYDDTVVYEIWIVKQNFDFYYEEDFEDEPELLNADGERYQIVNAFEGHVRSVGFSFLSLSEAVESAEEVVVQGIKWINQRQQKLYKGRWYLLEPEQSSVSHPTGSVVFKTNVDA